MEYFITIIVVIIILPPLLKAIRRTENDADDF